MQPQVAGGVQGDVGGGGGAGVDEVQCAGGDGAPPLHSTTLRASCVPFVLAGWLAGWLAGLAGRAGWD